MTMKKILLATTGTLAGLGALLGSKWVSQPLAPTGGLPQASLNQAGVAGGTTTSAPSPFPGRRDRHRRDGGPAPAPRSTAATGTAPVGPITAGNGGTYKGKAIDTQYGVVQVKITVSGGKITNAAFVQLTAFDGHSQEINSYAGPILLQETLKAQSAQVDTVSGATYTSDGYLQSLQSALDSAGLK